MTQVEIFHPDERDAHFLVVTEDGTRGRLVNLTLAEATELRDKLTAYVANANGLLSDVEVLGNALCVLLMNPRTGPRLQEIDPKGWSQAINAIWFSGTHEQRQDVGNYMLLRPVAA